MDFTPSEQFSVGMEMELQLLDATSLDLVEGIMPVLKLFPDSPHIKAEFIQNSVEVTSDPCPNVAALERNLRLRVAGLLKGCASLNMRLASAGTHPFGRRLALITPTPRYRALEQQAGAGYFSHAQIVFATHVHLGMPDGDEAIRLMSELKPYLPVLLALSANSPYWRGQDTGFAAYRHRILAATRSYGQPPDFSDWVEFTNAFEGMMRAGAFESINDVHWDLRPRPAFGTLEVRIMDAQITVAHAAQMAAFIRALVGYLRASRDDPASRPLQPVSWWMLKDNCFLASRFGRAARFMVEPGGRTVPMRTLIVDLFDRLLDHADANGERPYLDQLAERCQTGLDCEQQRAVHDDKGSLEAVVVHLVSALEDEQGSPIS